MALLRTKYSGELSVLLTWLVATLPWSVTVASLSPTSAGQAFTVVWIRFLPLRFLYILNGSVPGERPLLPVWSVPGFVGTGAETTAAWLWIVGTALFLVPLGLSIVHYFDEARLEAIPVDPVRLQGALLCLVGLVFVVPTYLLSEGIPGTTLPVGTVFLLAFGLVLLRVEQVQADGAPE